MTAPSLPRARACPPGARCPPLTGRTCAGFTLLELLVVFALTSLVIGATFLSVNVRDTDSAARRAAARLALELDLARLMATSHGRRVDWRPDTRGGRFSIAGGSEDEHQGAWSPPDAAERLGLRPIPLPSGHRLRVLRGNGETLAFFADGRHEAAEILIEGSAGPVARIRLPGFGPVRLEDGDDGWRHTAAVRAGDR